MMKSNNAIIIEKNKQFEIHSEKNYVDFSCFDCVTRSLDVETIHERPVNAESVQQL